MATPGSRYHALVLQSTPRRAANVRGFSSLDHSLSIFRHLSHTPSRSMPAMGPAQRPLPGGQKSYAHVLHAIEGEGEVITMLLHYWYDGLPVPCVRRYIHVKGRGVTLPLLMSLLHARKGATTQEPSRVQCRRGRAYAFESLRALKGSIRLPRT